MRFPPIPLVLLGSGALWLSACALPGIVAHDVGGQMRPFLGVECLMQGAYFAVLGCFAWYANLTTLAAGVLLWRRRYRWTVVLTLASVALALTTFVLFAGTDAVPSSGSADSAREHVALGFWVWLASLVGPGAAASWFAFHDTRAAHPTHVSS